MPDRLSPQCAISALTSVPRLVPGARMHDQPGGLVDDDDVGVLVESLERDRFGVRAQPARPAEASSEISAPAARRVFGSSTTRPSTATRPVHDERLQAAAREAPARRARKASSRSPAASGSTRKASFSMRSAMAPPYDTDDDAPLDPAAERLRRKLVRLLLVSGGIMMLGLIAVFAAIVYKLSERGGGVASRLHGGIPSCRPHRHPARPSADRRRRSTATGRC